MELSKKNKIVLCYLLIFALCSGCAATQDGKQTQVQGTAVGAVIGALVGQAIGKNTAGTAIGASIGAALGYGIGTEIQKRKSYYANTEQFLNAEIQSAAKTNKQLESYIVKLESDIKYLQNYSQQLVADYKKGKKKKSDLVKVRSVINKRIKDNSTNIATVGKEILVKKELISQGTADSKYGKGQIKALKKEVALLEKNISKLQNYDAQLASVDDRLTL